MAENYFRNLTVTFNSHTGIKKPDMTDKEKFYKIYSPKKFKLRPTDDIYLDLRFNIETSKELQPWISLLPSLKGFGLAIENEDWENNLTKDNTIQLHLFKRSFNYTLDIYKKQCIGFIFLLGEFNTDIITTKYIIKNYICLIITH